VKKNPSGFASYPKKTESLAIRRLAADDRGVQTLHDEFVQLPAMTGDDLFRRIVPAWQF
jgi:hypothetical protein